VALRLDLIYVRRIVGGKGERRLLALASKERLVRILEKMLDPEEFLSDHGIRSWVNLAICIWPAIKTSAI